MDGRAFLETAQDLLTFGKEAHWRTAAVCAYYALMLEGRDALERWGFRAPPRSNIHAFVRLNFTYAANPDLQRIGRALDDLVQLRNHAHYQPGVVGPFATNQKAAGATVIARDAIAVLDQIEGDPAQQTAAIAAIRAAGS